MLRNLGSEGERGIIQLSRVPQQFLNLVLRRIEKLSEKGLITKGTEIFIFTDKWLVDRVMFFQGDIEKPHYVRTGPSFENSRVERTSDTFIWAAVVWSTGHARERSDLRKFWKASKA
jgi:hypothetical protein